MFKVLRAQSDLGIVRHQNANCNSPLMIFESFEPDHVSYVFLPHRIIRMEIERHDDIHAWEVVIHTGRKIESSSRHVQGRANFLSIFRITGANKNRFRYILARGSAPLRGCVPHSGYSQQIDCVESPELFYQTEKSR